MKRFLVTGLGLGYLPIAPGTWGSAGAVAVFLLVAHFSGGRTVCTAGTLVAMAIIFSIICVALGDYAERVFAKKDPGQVTSDEWAGQAVTLLGLPLGVGPAQLLITAAAGFFAFRFFDIVKPPPARGLQRIHGGWGILIDDLIAGVYANIVCQVILRWGLGWV